LVFGKTRLSRVCAVRLIVVLRGCGVVFRRCVGPRVGTLRQECPSCGSVPTKTAGTRLVRLRPFVSVCVFVTTCRWGVQSHWSPGLLSSCFLLRRLSVSADVGVHWSAATTPRTTTRRPLGVTSVAAPSHPRTSSSTRSAMEWSKASPIPHHSSLVMCSAGQYSGICAMPFMQRCRHTGHGRGHTPTA
jgi:hypothetical protein